MLKIFSVIVAVRDLLKYLYQFAGLVRGMVVKQKSKEVTEAIVDLKKAEDADAKKDALRKLSDNSF